MKFRYLGEEENMNVFGYDFSNQATPDVTEEMFIAKLTGNSHFETVKEDKKKLSAPGNNPDSTKEWPLS